MVWGVVFGGDCLEFWGLEDLDLGGCFGGDCFLEFGVIGLGLSFKAFLKICLG